MQEGVRLEFGQPWFAQLEPGFQPGKVWLGIQGDTLVVYAVLQDEAPANRALSWSEPTWLMGDVLELFFQAEGRPGYYEFHVTPENQRLQLFFPSTEAFHEKRTFQHWMLLKSKFESQTRLVGTSSWEVMMRIKLSLVLAEPREDGSRQFRFLVSRYDYQAGREAPVTSATGALDRPDFHHIAGWTNAMAAE